MPEIPVGYCQCGCGAKTKINEKNNTKKGIVKGTWQRFKRGHHYALQIGPTSFGWKGGKYMDSDGYVMIYSPDHPRKTRGGYVAEHILVAEKSVGRFLTKEEEVHHANEIKDDNSPANLILCPDHTYHMALHQQAKALKECGHSEWRKCVYCHEYDAPENLKTTKSRWSYHKACDAKRAAQRRKEIREI